MKVFAWQLTKVQFVVDGDNWTIDPTAPQETDSANNVNNVLTPDTLSKPATSPMSDPTSNMISGVTPQSTTAALAAQVPKESERGQDTSSMQSGLPGSFPETPAPNDMSEYGVKPIPASEGIGNPVHLQPGEEVPDPSTINDNTISSTAQNDPLLAKTVEQAEGEDNPTNSTTRDNPSQAEDAEKTESKAAGESTFGVSPLPATSGIGNPIQLPPGEKVPDPSTFTSNTIQSNVQLDRGSYERGQDAPQLPNVVTPPSERQGDMFSVPGISGIMIPESSLPMGGGAPADKDVGPFVQSGGQGSTTAALAAKVPLEPRGVPEVVEDSQQEAGITSEASGNQDAVGGKSAVEKELESKVPEKPAISEGTGSAGTTSLPSRGLPSSIQQSIDEMNKGTAIAPTVPDVVQESITESHQSPEAAANKSMVQEKANVEAELLKGQTPDESAGEPAPSTSAALTETAPAATTSSTQPDIVGATPSGTETSTAATSTAKDATDPNTTALSTSTDPRSVPTITSTSAGSSEPPASTSKDTSALTPATENAKHRDVSRSVSPMTRTGQAAKDQPSVTSGVSESSAPAQSKTAAQAAHESSSSTTSPAASSSTTDKKSKRASGFFGKLKSKFSDKDKK